MKTRQITLNRILKHSSSWLLRTCFCFSYVLLVFNCFFSFSLLIGHFYATHSLKLGVMMQRKIESYSGCFISHVITGGIWLINEVFNLRNIPTGYFAHFKAYSPRASWSETKKHPWPCQLIPFSRTKPAHSTNHSSSFHSLFPIPSSRQLSSKPCLFKPFPVPS